MADYTGGALVDPATPQVLVGEDNLNNNGALLLTAVGTKTTGQLWPRY